MNISKQQQIEWSIAAILLLALSFSIYGLYKNMQTDEASSATYNLVLEKQKSGLPQQPTLTLKLNNAHQRQGAEIQVDPNNIGKSNPFTK